MPRPKLSLPNKPALETPRPSLGLPDPLEAAQEEARHAKEGALKLARAIDALRSGLETIVAAEWNNEKNCPVSQQELRALAAAALDAYSRLTGQSWKRNPLVNSWAGDRNTANLDAP